MNAYKTKAIIIITLISSIGYLCWSINSSEGVLFASLESKSTNNQIVYNEIKFFSDKNKDIWMMNQRHYGINTEKNKIDRLAIVVNKNKTTEFYQLLPGELVWSDDLPNKKIENRVSCFMCHSNGPRAIRPDDKYISLTFKEKIKIAAWNFRIKTYGPLRESQKQIASDLDVKIPFRHRASLDNDEFPIQTCQKCHNNESIFGRGVLTRQNLLAIQFMLKNKIMPPLGMTLSDSETKKIDLFVKGF